MTPNNQPQQITSPAQQNAVALSAIFTSCLDPVATGHAVAGLRLEVRPPDARHHIQVAIVKIAQTKLILSGPVPHEEIVLDFPAADMLDRRTLITHFLDAIDLRFPKAPKAEPEPQTLTMP